MAVSLEAVSHHLPLGVLGTILIAFIISRVDWNPVLLGLLLGLFLTLCIAGLATLIALQYFMQTLARIHQASDSIQNRDFTSTVNMSEIKVMRNVAGAVNS